LWAVRAAVLVALAASTGWPAIRAALTRAAVARLVISTAGAPAPGELAATLGRALGDPSVRILYPLADGRLVDGTGAPTHPVPDRVTTRLIRDDATVGFLEHRQGVLGEDAVAERVADIARLAVVHERLMAEQAAQLADLRVSRARIVEAADAERQRLERDLHDGAQQRLVALSLRVQLAALRLPGDAGPAVGDRHEAVGGELRTAMAALRGIARGLYPRELADEGLAAALDVLAESCSRRIQVQCLVQRRLPGPVEAAAYFAVAALVRDAPEDVVSVCADQRDDAVRVEVALVGPAGDLRDIRDRAGALAGTVTTARVADGTGTLVRVELPCGS
jgi:signal transduction histidine kinase